MATALRDRVTLVAFLTLSSLSLSAVVEAQTAQRPTFNCAKPSGEIEAMICKDPALIALDRQLADVYARALKRLPAKTAAEQRTVQRGWIAERNACVDRDDPRACTEITYQIRIVELQIRSGQLKGPKPVGYVCTGGEGQPLSVTFYTEAEPKAAVVTYGKDQVIAFAARVASGFRYAAKDVDLREDQGEATLTWSGTRVTCRPAESGR
jgi:uncharacterized protein